MVNRRRSQALQYPQKKLAVLSQDDEQLQQSLVTRPVSVTTQRVISPTADEADRQARTVLTKAPYLYLKDNLQNLTSK